MNKSKLTQKIVRETTADIDYNDEAGDIKQETMTVRFQSLSTAELRERQLKSRELRKKDETYWLAEELQGVVIEIIEADGTRHPATLELLESMSVDNLRKLSTAIDEAVRPKEPAGK
jgi:hypothetical protein